MLSCTVEILQIVRQPLWLLACETYLPAGFPSPADDHRGERIDLNAILLPHPDCTYLARVRGNSMDGAPSHIADGALLTVDCSRTPQPGDIVVAAVNGEFTVKRHEKRGAAYWLVPDNPAHEAIEASVPGQAFEVWGVVTLVVTALVKGQLQPHVRARRLQ